MACITLISFLPEALELLLNESERQLAVLGECVLDAVISVVALATILAVILVFALSLRLRQREIQTIFRLGCRRANIARLLAAENFIIVIMSGVFCGALIWLVNQFSNDQVRMLFIR